MEEAGEVVGASPIMSKAEAEAGMRAKSQEFLAEAASSTSTPPSEGRARPVRSGRGVPVNLS